MSKIHLVAVDHLGALSPMCGKQVKNFAYTTTPEHVSCDKCNAMMDSFVNQAMAQFTDEPDEPVIVE